MKIVNINPVTDKRWLEFTESMSRTTIFHHPSWINVLQKQYKFKAFVICTEDNNGKISSGIPFCEVTGITGSKRWVSLPFSDYCTVLANDDKELEFLLGYVIDDAMIKKIDSIEIRSDLPENTKFEQKPEAYIHTLSLNKETEDLPGTFNKSRTMRGINKAQKEGLIYDIGYSFDDMEEFYRLHLKTRKKLGVPIQPKKFFVNIFKEIIEKKLGFICLVKKDDIPLSAGLFAGIRETMTYKFGASDPRMLHLKPNHLMFWGAITESHKKGFRYFDFGKTDFDGEGLREFKLGWGTKESTLYYSYFPKAPLEKVPGILKKSLIPFIIKNSPAFVCRLSGELFYKYQA